MGPGLGPGSGVVRGFAKVGVTRCGDGMAESCRPGVVITPSVSLVKGGVMSCGKGSAVSCGEALAVSFATGAVMR